MSLQSSGQISLSEIRDEFQGSNPIRISDYYRGGSLVPIERTLGGVIKEPESGFLHTSGSEDNNTYWSFNTFTNPNQVQVLWKGTSTLTGETDPEATSVTFGGWTYFKGPFAEDGKYFAQYSVRREQPGGSVTEEINIDVPLSGLIKISDFYNGESE